VWSRFCNSTRGRSWNTSLCWNVAFRQPEALRKNLTAFSWTSMCTCTLSHFRPHSECQNRRNSTRASSFALNLGKTVQRFWYVKICFRWWMLETCSHVWMGHKS
jgi:hypothetical protein